MKDGALRPQQGTPMPIIRLTATQANEYRKTNAYRSWGDRASPNRVEPITRPGFRVPFKMQPGSRIFTVGSCFARNVEDELIRRGFDVPMRRMMPKNSPSAILNNFATPSIYNEFAWAFGEAEFHQQHHFFEVQPGRFADLHLAPTLRPEPLEAVIERRAEITAAYRQAADCPVMIMTLGVAEVWFDTVSGYYVNVAPRPSHLRAEPDRFEMHILSFDDAHDYLDRTVRLLQRHGHPDLRILLTVSPVPLTATHRDEDVIVANCYSKSALRTVAETICARYDFVTYFPSYESVTLSDRRRAWWDDFVHVTDEMVALNVGRMVDAFIEAVEDPDAVRTAVAAGGEAAVVEKAAVVRKGSREAARAFFAEFGPQFAASPEFVQEHVGFLMDAREWAAAHAALENAPGSMPERHTTILRARVLVGLARSGEALALLEEYAADGRPCPATFWDEMLTTSLAAGDPARITAVLSRFVAAAPAYAARAHIAVAQWFYRRGSIVESIPFFHAATGESGMANQAWLYLAEALEAVGRRDEAREALAQLNPAWQGPKVRVDRLIKVLG